MDGANTEKTNALLCVNVLAVYLTFHGTQGRSCWGFGKRKFKGFALTANTRKILSGTVQINGDFETTKSVGFRLPSTIRDSKCGHKEVIILHSGKVDMTPQIANEPIFPLSGRLLAHQKEILRAKGG